MLDGNVLGHIHAETFRHRSTYLQNIAHYFNHVSHLSYRSSVSKSAKQSASLLSLNTTIAVWFMIFLISLFNYTGFILVLNGFRILKLLVVYMQFVILLHSRLPPPSVWPHLFCSAGHEKRRGEQLKWSLTFRQYVGSFPCAQLPGPVHTARLGRMCFNI